MPKNFKSLVKNTRKKFIQYAVVLITIIPLFGSCKKDATVGAEALYIPTTINVTANATLQDLLDGRELYISYCSQCHGLYLPEHYTPQQWKTTMISMGSKTGLSSSDQLLITKYLCKGLQ